MVDDDISFIYEENTEVELSCAATLKDQMWVLGGSSQKRQVIFKRTDKQQPAMGGNSKHSSCQQALRIFEK